MAWEPCAPLETSHTRAQKGIQAGFRARAPLRHGDALAAVLGREPEPLLSVVVEVEPVVQAVGVRAELVGKADK